MEKMLITGATGFVGKHLVNRIECPRCVVRTQRPYHFFDTFEIKSLDDTTNWSLAFDGIESVIHLAGIAHTKSESAAAYRKVNTEGTLHLAEEAAKAGVKRFVFVSTIGVNSIEADRKPFSKSTANASYDLYVQSKYDAECGLKKLAKDTGLEVVVIRPTLVYGPNAPGNFGNLTKLIERFPFLPFGLAANRRDFIAVQNLVDLLLICASHPKAPGHIFFASDSETVSIKEFTNAIGEGLEKKVIQLPIPTSVMRIVGKITGKSAMIEQLYGNLEVDSSNIKEVLGWVPPYTMKQAMALLSENE